MSDSKTLIAGVGHRFWRDRSAGPEFCDRLAKLPWPEGVRLEDYSFGAIPMTYQLQDDQYQRALFIASESRGFEPGTLRLYRADPELPQSVEVFQEYMNEAGSGVIAIELLLVIAKQFAALPPETWVLELEPVEENGPDGLTPQMEALYPKVQEVAQMFVAGQIPEDLVTAQTSFALRRPFTPRKMEVRE